MPNNATEKGILGIVQVYGEVNIMCAKKEGGRTMTEKERREYLRWMYNPENSHCCEECPENRGERRLLPCGQQNCWVDCHCRKEE